MDNSELLHDDELLLVLGLLPLASLLQARAVCRRWRALALDARVWRHRDLRFHSIPESLTELVTLRVAPCLRSLNILSAYYLTTRPGCAEAAVRTECAVTELSLRFGENDDGSSDYHLLEQVLQRQVELGASGVLRRVALWEVDPARAVFVVGLALRANLDELQLGLKPRRPSCSAVLSDEAASGSAALKALRFDSGFYAYASHPDPPLVLQPLLRAHAATLESLAVRSVWFGGNEELLAHCTRLRRLELNACAANARALAATQITDLTLVEHVYINNDDLKSFVPFLRAATQLRRLWVCCWKMSLSVLRALTESGSSCLEELTIDTLGHVSLTSLLDTVAKGLPQLRSLSVQYAPRVYDPLLEGTCTSVLPCLQMLRVGTATCHSETYYINSGPWVSKRRCSLPALHDLVRRNPQIHVLGLLFGPRCSLMHKSSPKFECGCCAHGLHPELEDGQHYSLYGHGEGGQCCLPAHSAWPGRCPCKLGCKRPHTWVQVV